MGIRAIPLKNGKTSYQVSVQLDGRQFQRRVGTDRRKAEQIERRIKREIRDGSFSPEHRSGSLKFETYARAWCDKRTNRTAGDDLQRTRDHIVPFFCGTRLEDVSRRGAQRFAESLKGKFKSRNTRKNVWGTFVTMMRDAELEGLIGQTPCKIPRGFFGRSRSAATKRRPYTADEVLVLIDNKDIPLPVRVWIALAFYTGMRQGEVCGRRWTDWDRTRCPLGSLRVATQYADQPLKTDDDAGEHAREIPVHPELERVLEDWWEHGFELYVGRKPTSGDWIVPQKFDKSKPPTKSSSYKAFHRACELGSVDAHTVHSTRHTFISAARNGGARKDVLEIITHNARGDVIDGYSHFDWPTLCQSVLCVRYSADAASNPRLTNDAATASCVAPGSPANPSPEGPSGPALHDALHDASRKSAVSLREMGGGAGNRTRRMASVCNGFRRFPRLWGSNRAIPCESDGATDEK